MLLAIAAAAVYVLFRRHHQQQRAPFAQLDTGSAPNTTVMMDNPMYLGAVLGSDDVVDHRYNRLDTGAAPTAATPDGGASATTEYSLYQVVGTSGARPDPRRAKDDEGYVVQPTRTIVTMQGSGGAIYAVPVAMDDSEDAIA